MPDNGEYQFNLIVKAKNCIDQEGKRENSEVSDMDSATHVESTLTPVIAFEVDQCDPLTYKIWDNTHHNGLYKPGINPEWKIILVSNGTEIYSSIASIGQDIIFTFPTLDEKYKIELKSGEQVCSSCQPIERELGEAYITPTSSTWPKPDFEVAYYDSCKTDEFLVQFTNTSENIKCPVEWTWDFGDRDISNEENPSHLYNTNDGNEKTITLTATNLNLPVTDPDRDKKSLPKTIVLQQWKPDFTYKICPDGTIIFETNDGCEDKDAVWDFTGELATISGISGKIIREKITNKSTFEATLTATNCNRGRCSITKEIEVPGIVSCIKYDKDKIPMEFEYDNRKYRLISTFRYHGGFNRRIVVKTKVQRQKNNGKWRAQKATYIELNVSGSIYTGNPGSITGCDCSIEHKITFSKQSTKKKRILRRTYPTKVGKFKVRQEDLVAAFTVKIDDDHNGYTDTIALHKS